MKGDPEWTYEEMIEVCQGITECESHVREVRSNMSRFNKCESLKTAIRNLKEAVENLQNTISTYW